jgi:hypothetical protein
MRTLPYDYARCKPTEPDSHCKKCLRWADLPEQTWGGQTPVFMTTNSAADGCEYIPVTKEAS